MDFYLISSAGPYENKLNCAANHVYTQGSQASIGIQSGTAYKWNGAIVYNHGIKYLMIRTIADLDKIFCTSVTACSKTIYYGVTCSCTNGSLIVGEISASLQVYIRIY